MRLKIIAMCMALCGCSEARELAKTEIVVHAPRAEVFDTAFNVDDIKRSIPLVSNSGTDQLFELTMDDRSPGWSSAKPKEVPFAKELKVKMTLEDRREAALRYSINGNDVKTGVVWRFEDMDGGRTKVSFDLLPLEGDRTEGLTLNQLELRILARASLDKIERMAKERGGGTVDSSNEG